jgi:uncharacterized protein YcaQ
VRTFSPEAARRLAIAAQGLAAPRPTGRVDLRHLRQVFAQVGAVQIDPINVVERAPHLTLFSRLGPHDHGLLWRAYNERHEIMEQFAHAACFVPVEDYPLLRHRAQAVKVPRAVRDLEARRPGYLQEVLAEVRRRGPVAATELEEPGERNVPYWGTGWTAGKLALEWLFVKGQLLVSERRGLVRRYDLPERVLPPHILGARVPERVEARRELLLLAARSLGVATLADLASYYYFSTREARPLVESLAAAGALQIVEVEGWKGPAYLHPEAAVPRRVEARALLGPFDSLIWDRRRTERVFGFYYRSEIYLPAPKRTWGYYVFPFLLGDRLVGRVDLKADRARGLLVAPGAFLEPGHEPAAVAAALREELRAMAGWLGLGGVEVGDRGDLAGPLRAALSGSASL